MVSNEYMAKYMTERYHRRRKAAIKQLGGKCVDCGTMVDLSFDHDDATTKTYDMGKILSTGSEAKVQAELVKCVLRCIPCHNEKSRKQGDYTRRAGQTCECGFVAETHGQYTGHRTWHCPAKPRRC